MPKQNSHTLIDQIIAKLFEPEDRRMDKWIKTLTTKNSELKGAMTFGFLHQGKRYICSDYQSAVTAQRKIVVLPTLHAEVMIEANSFITELTAIELDKAQIKQVLFQLVYQANTQQELRDTLPDCVVNLFPELSKLQRQFNQTFLIRTNDRAMRQFEQVLPKIEMYAMAQFIY